MEGGRALLAFRRAAFTGEMTEEAELGAIMEADFQAAVCLLVEAYFKVHKK